MTKTTTTTAKSTRPRNLATTELAAICGGADLESAGTDFRKATKDDDKILSFR